MINAVYNFFFHAVTTMSNFVFKTRLLLRIDDFFLFKLEFFFIFYMQFENQNAKICPIASLYYEYIFWAAGTSELMGFRDVGTSTHQILTDKFTGGGGGGTALCVQMVFHGHFKPTQSATIYNMFGVISIKFQKWLQTWFIIIAVGVVPTKIFDNPAALLLRDNW